MKLLELKRNQYISDTKKSDEYSLDNQDKGKNRFQRRTHSKVSRSTTEYNRIDMNKLFTEGLLDVNILVHGETNDYTVRVTFGGILDHLHKELDRSNNELSRRVLLKALVGAFNSEDIQTKCNCPDATYRQNYWLSKKDAIAGEKEVRPSDETNPEDTKGSGCKHTQVVLTNNSWLQLVSNVIYNYVNYMEKHYENMYATIIYPAIYQGKYEEPAQMDMSDSDTLATDEDDIDTSNKWAREKNRFKPGNEYRFKKHDTDDVDGQMSFDLDSLADDADDLAQ